MLRLFRNVKTYAIQIKEIFTILIITYAISGHTGFEETRKIGKIEVKTITMHVFVAI